MSETYYQFGFADGQFFVGCCESGDDELHNCLVMVFDQGQGGVSTNLVSPVPFGLTKNNVMVLPSIKKSRFTYLLDLVHDIDNDNGFIEYYKNSVEYELTKHIQKPQNSEAPADEEAEVMEGTMPDTTAPVIEAEGDENAN